MIDLKVIRENPEKTERGIRSKGINISLKPILEMDENRRKLVTELGKLRNVQNKESSKVPKLKGSEKKRIVENLGKLKEEITAKELELKELEQNLELALYQLPNLPLPDVPEGKDEADNVVIREVGKKRQFNFLPKNYLEISENLGIIDVERAAKVSGSRFGYLKQDAALLEFALLHFGIDTLTQEDTLNEIISKNNLNLPPTPFIPIIPPVLIRPSMLGKMGYLKKTRTGWENEEVYFMRDDDLVLVGTSEQSIGPMHSNEIFSENDLPLRYLGFSSCFRREAGSYGKDTKGILRVHQFDKLEMFSYTRQEYSIEEHKFMLGCEEYLMQKLEIPYRVVNICTGDLGVSAAAKFDIEAWLPGQNNGKGEYRETHSTSNTTDFQARRLNIKYRSKDGKLEFVHMLNGTALAMGRMIIAIIENYQTKEGKVRIPKVLQKYIGKEIIG